VRFLCVLFLLAASPAVAGEPASLTDAREARSLLGPEIWARLVRIDSTPTRGLEKRTAYPRTEYGLVFELSGILWFYCDADGTQSLSLRRGSLESDKADPGPLLRALSAHVTSWSWVDAPAGGDPPVQSLPPNGCLIECLALLQRRLSSGEEAGSPRLLLFYVQTPFGTQGHATLVFDLKDALAAIEPDRPGRVLSIPGRAGKDARSISEYIRGGSVSFARVLPLTAFEKIERPARWATLLPPGAPAG
jgi:hypothetical protein